GYRGRRRFVQQRSIRDRQPGQIDNHRLEGQQRLEPALRNLGLIGRVLGIPVRIFQDAALDDGRYDGVVVAHPDEGGKNLVLLGQRAGTGEEVTLRQCLGKLEWPAEPDPLRDGLVDEFVECRAPQALEHLLDFFRAGAVVSPDEVVRVREIYGHRDELLRYDSSLRRRRMASLAAACSAFFLLLACPRP